MAETKRCAIYTRKSTEDGLEQDFNSLDAQREACAAYILSQAHEGWQQVAELYDDGGWSGGNVERPALRQLLADVAAGKVDIIVVYKVDRLTRSLADFAKIVEILDENEASFVSVTQAFNTTNSMGRLTLNVLLSFAQFEREVTGERIRDKIAASKKKGMWMGGPVPLGYRLEERKLLIEPDEASVVRMIFERYIQLRSIPRLVEELARRGIRTKQRTYQDGRTVGGIPFAKGALAALLKNPLYSGRVRHGGKLYKGEHEAIVEVTLFEQVQAIFGDNGRDWRLGKKADNPSLLTGLLVDPDGRPMTPVHTSRGHKRYRYYVTRYKPGEAQETPWRVPAGELDKLAIRTVRQWLRHDIPGDAEHTASMIEVAESLSELCVPDQRKLLLEHDLRFELGSDAFSVSSNASDRPCTTRSLPAQLVTNGQEKKLLVPPEGRGEQSAPDPVLLKLLAQARAAHRMVLEGSDEPSVSHYSKRHLWQLLRIGWLAPDIVSDIVEGRQPSSLTGRRLLRASDLPLDWVEQRACLGFS